MERLRRVSAIRGLGGGVESGLCLVLAPVPAAHMCATGAINPPSPPGILRENGATWCSANSTVFVPMGALLVLREDDPPSLDAPVPHPKCELARRVKHTLIELAPER